MNNQLERIGSLGDEEKNCDSSKSRNFSFSDIHRGQQILRQRIESFLLVSRKALLISELR
ncbi:MAG: hypothetical protein ACMV16_01795 [Macromonas sp.]